MIENKTPTRLDFEPAERMQVRAAGVSA